MKAALISGGYQLLEENYAQIGIGFQFKKKLLASARLNPKYAFNGLVLNALKSVENENWGVSAGYLLSIASLSGPLIF